MTQTLSRNRVLFGCRTSFSIYIALAIALSTGSPTALSGAVQQRCFHIFDATLFQRKPNLTVEGLELATVVDPHRWLSTRQARGEIPNESAIMTGLRATKTPSSILVLDSEDWPNHGAPVAVAESVNKYLTLLSLVRHAGIEGLVGFYGVPPVRDYWRAVDLPNSQLYHSWQSDNDLLQPLADAVDVLFPSIYTFYDDENGWTRYAIANLSEARRLARGKPVYAFIWPQYNESNKSVGLELIPGRFWALQLQTVAKYADGAVIWGGWHKVWDEEAEWWQATREFVRTQPHRCSAPNAPSGVQARP
jgi:hypothetical protein